MWFFMFSDTSLLRTCFFGTMPARFSRSRSALYACIISSSLRLPLHGLHKDGVVVDFYHYHDVLVVTLRRCRELTCLVGEHGFAYPVCFGVDVLNFLSVELGGVTRFQRGWFGFGGAHILSCLIQMVFCCFSCLGVVFLYISFI